MMIPAGTPVRLLTTNGGDTVVTLDHRTEIASDNIPTYPVTVTNAFGGSFTVMPQRVRSLTIVAG